MRDCFFISQLVFRQFPNSWSHQWEPGSDLDPMMSAVRLVRLIMKAWMIRAARRDSECYVNDEGDIWKSVNSREYVIDCYFANRHGEEVSVRKRKAMEITRPLTS